LIKKRKRLKYNDAGGIVSAVIAQMGSAVRVPTLAILLSLPLACAQATELRDLHLLDGPESTRVVFDLDAETAPKIFTLANPDRVVVDFVDAKRAAGLRLDSAGKGVVKSVRTGPHDKGLRVVLDVEGAVSPQSFGLQPSGSYGYRLILDLVGPASAAPPKPTAPVPTPPANHEITAQITAAAETPAVKTPAVSSPTPAVTVASAPAVAAAQPVERVSAAPERAGQAERTLIGEKTIVVAVDAGHGGEDPGARGLNGLLEKDVTLAIARKLAQRINAQPGMRAVLTRDGDYYVDLRERTVKARKVQADLFVSVHANAYKDRDMRGTAVYVLSDRGVSSEQARWIANHENAADLVGGVKLQNKDDDLAAVLIDISQSATMEASFDLGGRLLDSLGKVNSLQKQQVQQAGFMVLKSPDIPSVLVETAFISNPYEERLLRDDSYRDKLAGSIFEGVRSYFTRYRPLQQVASAAPASEPAAPTPRAGQGRVVRVSLSHPGTE
jgi:N-acetylmuramoyl-L-alanine amidase